jgi:hypothetical protein
MLCEALTQLPHSLVFNEPNLALRRFAIRNTEAELLATVGVDLNHFVRQWSRGRRRLLLYGFRKRLVPEMQKQVAQVGIKEIFHDGWRRIVDGFPDTRIILSARDPRDIFLSLRGRHLSGTAIWKGEFTPERVAESLNSEFWHQREMAEGRDVLKVRYEDLCLEPQIFGEVLRFVESDITSIGELGGFLRADRERIAEGALHGGQITDKRVARWRAESGELAEQARRVFELMPGYCEFWHYAEDGPSGFSRDNAPRHG